MGNQQTETSAAGGQSRSNAGLGGEATPPAVTHGAGTEYTGKDGLLRRLVVQRYEDETIRFSIDTYWDGDDKLPTSTAIRVGTETYSAIVSLLTTFAVERERFRNPDYTTPNAEVSGGL